MYRIAFILIVITACSPEPSLDLYIMNATIIDGTGEPSFNANLGIRGDEIVYLSEEPFSGNSKRIIDSKGMYVTPGFIDLHAHGNPFETPLFENFLSMGVTTIVLGQDGSSPVSDLPEWKSFIDSAGTGVNVAMLLGHGSLRGKPGALTRVELNDMKSRMTRLLPLTFGMSTGLEYSPGLDATQEELIEMSKIIGENDLIIMSHMRNEDDSALLASINELAVQGKYARVHIAHLKSVYGKGKRRAEEILSYIDSLRGGGITITADIYPYTASYTGISILFPEWCKTEEQFAFVKNNRLGELRDFLRAKIVARNGPEATLFGSEPYTGKTLAQLAFEYNTTPEDFLIELVGPQGGSGAYFVMDEQLQERLMQDPNVAFCSDGSPTGYHPRGHGTYARILEEFVVNREILTLEESIRKMTSYPAEILGISDRGILRAGMKADLVIFDLAKVKETASYSSPHQKAEGFFTVIVNGQISLDQDQPVRAGSFLTR